MTTTSGPVLIAEIGSIITRITLLDQVDGEYRLLGRAETSSSIEPPFQNAMIGLLTAAAQISELTGRVLVRDNQLVMPLNSAGEGVDHLVVLSSASGTMSMVITAVARDVSARTALNASRSTYSSVLQVVTLDDAADQPATEETTPWIDRQVQAMLAQRPDVTLIAGGLEGGAVEALVRLAQLVGLTIPPTNEESQSLRRAEGRRAVLFAGNSAARDRIVDTLSTRSELLLVDNLRPSLSEEQPDPTRTELHKLYDRLVLPRLPGFSALRRLSRVPPVAACNASGLMARFLAERNARHVLVVDVGGTSTSTFLAGPAPEGGAPLYQPVVLGNCGTAYGISALLIERGLDKVRRWLPFAISDEELTHWLLNKTVRPQLLPTSREDLYLDHALARESLATVLETLAEAQPDLHYDMVVAGGGVLSHAPHPGFAALTLLDVLPPASAAPAAEGNATLLTLDLHLDTLGLLPACGALAALDPDAALTVFDRDFMRNVPLASYVRVEGSANSEGVAVEAEIIALGGRRQQITVRHGQIARLPLDPGAKAQLLLKPASDTRVGRNPPGVEMNSNLAAIGGSALGIIIDARRPFNASSSAEQRQAAMWDWLVALGAERGTSPYITTPVAVPAPVLITPPPAGPPNTAAATETAEPMPTPEPVAPLVGASEAGNTRPGSRISLDELRNNETVTTTPTAPSAAAMQDELAKLRQTVEEPPKKRGWFGREK
ncbi:MAG: glutamate mutase L [Chloroflexaceae bacterium]|jgi:hypothetical protein|nr:glutamate mutase L [Chloroflexaceae bacterium]